jgi:hypothetical protein
MRNISTGFACVSCHKSSAAFGRIFHFGCLLYQALYTLCSMVTDTQVLTRGLYFQVQVSTVTSSNLSSYTILYVHILYSVIKTSHASSCPKAHFLPGCQHFKVTAVSDGSMEGDNVSSADPVFTKKFWGLQKSHRGCFCVSISTFLSGMAPCRCVLRKTYRCRNALEIVRLANFGSSNDIVRLFDTLKNATAADSWSIKRPGHGSFVLRRSAGQKSSARPP